MLPRERWRYGPTSSVLTIGIRPPNPTREEDVLFAPAHGSTGRASRWLPAHQAPAGVLARLTSRKPMATGPSSAAYLTGFATALAGR